MTSYALLVAPSANRVYAQAAPQLTLAELAVLDATVGQGRFGAAEVTALGGVSYVAFEGDLTPDDLRHVANVSTALALFEREGDLLRPVALNRLDRFDDDLLTILKYRGKTNELFTRMLLNVTVQSSAASGRVLTDRLRILDPLCGRGTTLNQTLMYGWHAAGVDLDERDVEAYAAFLPTWLKRKRLKHTSGTSRLRRDGRTLGQRFQAEVAPDKEAWAAGEAITVTVDHADTMAVPDIFKAGGFDAIVTDAPYGVQHGSRSASSPSALQRSPLDLLAAALPGWVRVLRPGGAVGIAVNNRTSPRARTLQVLADAGLEPLDSAAYQGFEHRVDQAIVRDIVVAVKVPA